MRRGLFAGTCAGAAHAPPLRAPVPKRRPNSAAAWPRTAIRDCDGDVGSGFCGEDEDAQEADEGGERAAESWSQLESYSEADREGEAEGEADESVS